MLLFKLLSQFCTYCITMILQISKNKTEACFADDTAILKADNNENDINKLWTPINQIQN